MIYTAKQANNTEILYDIFEMYVGLNASVADITYGSGRFWRRYPDDHCFSLTGSDLLPKPPVGADEDVIAADYSCLPYRDAMFDVVVFDPPYGNASTSPRRDAVGKSYGCPKALDGYKVTPYPSGLREAYRIVKPKGYVIVKCQDGVNGGRQHWNHIDVHEAARNIGLKAEDLFVMVQKGKPMMRHDYQHHARKNHSYFWVFRK